MTISAKGRRRLEVDGNAYLWWVQEELDCFGHALTVASDDKHFLVRYTLIQSDEHRHVVVLGRRFRNETRGGAWRRYRCFAVGTHETVTPKDVAAFVRWCTTGTDALIEVDWNGVELR
jgi:hypothetical protein